MDDAQPEHSPLAESLRDEFTLWIKVKDRYESNQTSFAQLKVIAEWLYYHNIKSELHHRTKWKFEEPIIKAPMRTLQFANKFFIAIFPTSLEQWIATKIQWGEYLVTREL